MKRHYYKPNPNTPGRADHYVIKTRWLPSKSKERLTQYELRGDSAGGPIDKHVTDWGDFRAMHDAIAQLHTDLTGDGWVWTP